MTMDQNSETVEDIDAEDAELPETESMESEDAQDEVVPAISLNPAANDELIRVIEAMLFAAKQPLSLNAMRERLPEGADVGGLLLQLQNYYEGRGIALNNIDGYWAFRTATDLGDSLQLKKEVRRPLSRAAMETLAIVAYHQPVTRAEIENIRGVVTSGGTLDILMEEGWIKPGRRRETLGRPLTWITTTDFLDQFGLQALTDLPGLDDLKASGLLDRRPAIDATTADMFEQMEAEDNSLAAASEGDEEDMATEEELAALKEDREEEDEDTLEEIVDSAEDADAEAEDDESEDDESDEDESDDDQDIDDQDDEDEDEEDDK